jgi:hypothetical protein
LPWVCFRGVGLFNFGIRITGMVSRVVGLVEVGAAAGVEAGTFTFAVVATTGGVTGVGVGVEVPSVKPFCEPTEGSEFGTPPPPGVELLHRPWQVRLELAAPLCAAPTDVEFGVALGAPGSVLPVPVEFGVTVGSPLVVPVFPVFPVLPVLSVLSVLSGLPVLPIVTGVTVDVGVTVGVTAGAPLGVVGAPVGVTVGAPVGVTVGAPVGVTVGAPVGVTVGAPVGVTVGAPVGIVGVTVGVGAPVALGLIASRSCSGVRCASAAPASAWARS